MSVVLQKNCEYFLLEICKPLQCKASEAKISGLKPPDKKTLKPQGFMFIGTQCDLWGRPDGTGYEKSKSREFPSTYFFFDPKFI